MMSELKRIALSAFVAAGLFLLGGPTLNAARPPQVATPEIGSESLSADFGELIVAVAPDLSESELRSLVARSGASIDRWLPHLRLALVRFPASEETGIAAALASDEVVTYAIPNRKLFQVAEIPLDPYYPTQWGPAKIQAPAAWDIALSDPIVAIAILDTGISYLHWDLRDRTWYNPGESAVDPASGSRSCNTPLAYNGIDDDGNGYVDDCRGWDFVGMDNSPNDLHGHGTAVAGVAAASANNLVNGHYEGIAGIAPRASLMNVQVLDDDGNGYLYDIVSGLDYAATMGAGVVNLSFRFSVYEPPTASELDVLKRGTDAARAAGAVVVAATGNEAYNQVAYPAALDGVVAVGASTRDDARWSYSNHGAALDVVAPGVGITSTLIGGTHSYGLFGGTGTGTSYATPHVAGVAALIRGLRPDLSEADLRSFITSTADDLGEPGWDQYTGWGRVNAFGAVEAALQGLTLSLSTDDPGAAVGSSVTVTIQVRVAESGNSAGRGGRVDLTSNTGALTPGAAILDGDGRAAVRYTAGGSEGTAVIAAALGRLTATMPVEISSGIPFTMALHAEPQRIATGGSSSDISATVRDEGGSRVPDGVDVMFESTLGEISPTHAPTIDGIAHTTLTSGLTGGLAVITARAGSITGTVPVEIVGPGIPFEIDVAAAPDSIQVGGETTTVTATVRDGLGDLVVDGNLVHFETDLGVLSAPDVGTVAGMAAVQLSSGDAAGVATLRATSGPAAGETQVIIWAGAAETVTLTSDPPVLTAGYNQLSSLHAAAQDRYGNPVRDGTLLDFSASLGQVTPGQMGTHDGIAEVQLVGETVAGTSHVTVTAPSGAFGTADVRIDPAEPASLTLAMSADEVHVGGETVAITITLSDPFGNLVRDGTPVTVTTSMGTLYAGETSGPSLVALTQDGQAPLGLMSGSVAGTARVRVVAGVSLDETKLVQVLPGSPARIAVVLSSDEIRSGDKVQVDACVRDEFDNAVVDGTTVLFAVSHGSLEQSFLPTTDGCVTTWWRAGASGATTLAVVSETTSRFVQVEVLPAGYFLPWMGIR